MSSNDCNGSIAISTENDGKPEPQASRNIASPETMDVSLISMEQILRDRSLAQGNAVKKIHEKIEFMCDVEHNHKQ